MLAGQIVWGLMACEAVLMGQRGGQWVCVGQLRFSTYEDLQKEEFMRAAGQYLLCVVRMVNATVV